MLFESQQATIAFPQSLASKYQPETIAEFVGLDKPKRVLTNLLKAPKSCALLFCGPSGTGKTTMAIAFAKELNAEIHHIPSQKCDARTIADVVATCHRAPWNFYGPNAGKPARFHVVLVDEADRMTDGGQIQFLSVLDATAFPPSTIFIFTCNETRGLEPRFLSRTMQLDFSSYGMGPSGAEFLSKVWDKETPVSDAKKPNFAQILRDSRNNLRDALMTLEVELLAA
jgi:replication-associated recombination protein RarA